jgi:hypothetical protein
LIDRFDRCLHDWSLTAKKRIPEFLKSAVVLLVQAVKLSSFIEPAPLLALKK